MKNENFYNHYLFDHTLRLQNIIANRTVVLLVERVHTVTHAHSTLAILLLLTNKQGSDDVILNEEFNPQLLSDSVSIFEILVL